MPHQERTEKRRPADHFGHHRLVLALCGASHYFVARGFLDGHIHAHRRQLSLHFERQSLIDRVGSNQTGEMDSVAFSATAAKEVGCLTCVGSEMLRVSRERPMS